MAVVRRNPRITVLVFTMLAAAIAGWLICPGLQPALTDPIYTPLDAVTIAWIDVLRDDVGLDNDVLACVNLTSEQLTAVLPGVRSWFETHGADWWTVRTTVTQQRARVRHLEAACVYDSGDGGALTTARQELDQLETVLDTQFGGLRTTVATMLSAEQITLWERMRDHVQVSMPYRILDLGTAQDRARVGASHRYVQRLKMVEDAEQRAAAGAHVVECPCRCVTPADADCLGRVRQALLFVGQPNSEAGPAEDVGIGTMMINPCLYIRLNLDRVAQRYGAGKISRQHIHHVKQQELLWRQSLVSSPSDQVASNEVQHVRVRNFM